METDRSCTIFGAGLSAVNADALREALAPVMDKDALLVTEGNTRDPPTRVPPPLVSAVRLPNQSSGERIRGEIHIQYVNNRLSRLKAFIGGCRGISTKYLA